MHFSTRPKLSTLLSLVSTLAIIGACVVTLLANRQATRAASISSVISTAVKGTVSPSGTGNLLNPPISTKGSTNAGPFSLYQLFQEAAYPTEFLFDPHCQYDPATHDFFFMIGVYLAIEPTAHFDIAVIH
jgi:hypothetical protein